MTVIRALGVDDAVGHERNSRRAGRADVDAPPRALDGEQVGRRQAHRQVNEETLLLAEREIAGSARDDRVELIAALDVDAVDAVH